ncbi:MAG: hypothetical protein Q4B77_00095 [Coriobacteriaceae bacterium]|nr:hypothetical protein [Coriobacteriaceae bacterium]
MIFAFLRSVSLMWSKYPSIALGADSRSFEIKQLEPFKGCENVKPGSVSPPAIRYQPIICEFGSTGNMHHFISARLQRNIRVF